MLAVLALLACNPESEPPVEEEEDLPTEYLPPEQDPPVATLSTADIAVAVQLAVDEVMGMRADPIMAGYHAAMAGDDGVCPSYYSNEAGSYWFDQCTSDDGTEFSGYGFYYMYEDYYLPDNDLYVDGEQLFGSAVVTTADGYHFGAAGGASQISYHDPDETLFYWQSYIQGSFSYDGPEAADTWMDGELIPDTVYLAYRDINGGRYFNADGGIGGYTDDISAVAFDNIEIANETLGSPCALEPYGSISVRGADGHWYDALFDGAGNGNGWVLDDPDQCDGCGQAFFRGEALGEVCVDFSPLTDWEDPW